MLSAIVLAFLLATVPFGASSSFAAKNSTSIEGPSLASLAIDPAPVKQTNLMVLGDSLGRGVWAGLYHAFRKNKNFKVMKKAIPSTGFVRLDFYDWNANLVQILAETKIDIAVIMIGANDRQTIVTKSGRYKPGSPRWREIYASRVDGFIAKLKAHGAKIYWVGLPITRSKKYTRHMRVLNEIFAERARANNIAFVDIWKDFTTAKGKYSAHGKDINGRTRKLRANDGVHFTMRGYQKLALAAENLIRADLDKSDKVSPPVARTRIVKAQQPETGKKVAEIKIATVDPMAMFIDPGKAQNLAMTLNTMDGQTTLNRMLIRNEVPNSRVNTILWPKFQADNAYLAKNMQKIEKTGVKEAIRQALANDLGGILSIVQPDKAVVVDNNTAYAPIQKVQKSKPAVPSQRLQQRKIATLSLEPEVYTQSGKARVVSRVTGSVRPVSIESGTPDDSVEYATETTHAYGKDAFTGTSKLASIASVSGLDFDSFTDAEGILSTIVYRTLLRGHAVSPKAGRGDDFSWPRD